MPEGCTGIQQMNSYEFVLCRHILFWRKGNSVFIFKMDNTYTEKCNLYN